MSLSFFDDPGLAPKPRADIRITAFSLSAYDDRRRLKLDISLTPFAPADRPNLEIAALNSNQEVVASLSVIETMQHTMSFTLHIPAPKLDENYTVQVQLYYDEGQIQDMAEEAVLLPPALIH